MTANACRFFYHCDPDSFSSDKISLNSLKINAHLVLNKIVTEAIKCTMLIFFMQLRSLLFFMSYYFLGYLEVNYGYL